MKPKLPRLSKIILILCSLLLIAGTVSLFIVDTTAERSRIAFSMFETVLMIIVLFMPILLHHVVHIKLPAFMEIMFVVFCFGSLILGDVADLYAKIGWWDKLQHGISGILLGILAYAIINMFNHPESGSDKLRFPPLFVATWVICFAMAVGGLWEIIEYIVDGLFGLNSQQFLETTGTFDATAPLVGREALRDTMNDLILDFLGATLLAIWGYIDLRRQHKKNLRSKAEEIRIEIEEETSKE